MKDTVLRHASAALGYAGAVGTWAVAAVTVPPALCFAVGTRVALAPLRPASRRSPW